MKHWIFGAGMCALVLAAVTVGSSQDKPAAEPLRADMDEIMKQWEDMMKPGEMHARLGKFIGKWNVTMKVFMMPGAPPMESKGTAEYEWVLGERFVLERFKSEMMGQPFEGMGLLGFDAYKKMYVGSWADSVSTHLLSYRCAPNPQIDGMDCYGEMDEPAMGMQDRMVKYETRIITPSKHITTIYDLAAGPDYKVIEMTYER